MSASEARAGTQSQRVLARRPELGETRLRVFTVTQIETQHPGVQGRLRAWIHRADCGDPEMVGLREAVIRVGRSVLVDELRFVEFLRQRSRIRPAPDRRGAHREAAR